MEQGDNDTAKIRERFLQIFEQMQESDKAALMAGDEATPFARVLTLSSTDLGTARLSTSPYEINFPFRSFIVLDATDSNVAVSLKLGSRTSVLDSWEIKKGSQLTLPFPVKRAFLHWSAQSSKTMTILFLIKGEFSTNALNLNNSGGVSIVEGSSVSTAAKTMTAATASVIFAQDTTRLCGNFVNETGADLWIGPSTVTNSGATKGYLVSPGASITWRNTAALYGYSVAGGTVIAMTQI